VAAVGGRLGDAEFGADRAGVEAGLSLEDQQRGLVLELAQQGQQFGQAPGADGLPGRLVAEDLQRGVEPELLPAVRGGRALGPRLARPRRVQHRVDVLLVDDGQPGVELAQQGQQVPEPGGGVDLGQHGVLLAPAGAGEPQ